VHGHGSVGRSVEDAPLKGAAVGQEDKLTKKLFVTWITRDSSDSDCGNLPIRIVRLAGWNGREVGS